MESGSRHRSVSALFRPSVEWHRARLQRANLSLHGLLCFLEDFGFLLLPLDPGTYPVARSDKWFLFVPQFVQQVVGHLHTPGPQFS